MTLVALAGLAGCAKENADSPEKNPTSNTIVTLTANQENAETKAEISSENSKIINWTTDDAITVIDGAGNNVEFTLTEGEGTSSGKFKGEVSQTADSYTALYPYQKDVTASEGTLKGVVLKSEQTAVAGSFDPEAALMMAESEAGSLSFKNIVGFVKVTPTVSCARITLVSNNSESKLAGTADITMTDGKPTATVTDGASSSVSIVGDIKAGSTYYIAIFPETLSKGFRLVFTTADGQDTYKSTTKALEIKRSHVTNLGNVNGAADEYPYVTFTAAAEQTFRMKLASVVKDKLEYSVGGANWQQIVSDTEITFGGKCGSLRLRGKSSVGTANTISRSRIYFNNNEVEVSCKGDIRTLIDWENYKTANTGNARFGFLFKDCTVLISAPELPIMKFSSQSYCYEYMFSGCTKLTIAPELPATELVAGCYSYMFSGCSKLTSAPTLQATELAEDCYNSMFSGCSALTKAPDLPAENVPTSAYNYMFNKCSSLEEMPLISAKTVEKLGMAGMFAECSNLSKVKDLKIENFIGNSNCNGMFNGCTSLESAPKLPAMKVTWMCYQSMFDGCTSLKKAPDLPATEISDNCYQTMFRNCENLEEGPEVLPALTASMESYQQMFWGCKNLKKAPIIKAETMSKSSCQNMFRDCSSLTNVSDLSATTLGEDCYCQMFQGCTSLTSVPNLPATELTTKCYARMFVNCTNITEAVLPATTLAGQCYYAMFEGCSSLNKVTLKVKDFNNNDFDNGNLAPFEGWLVGTAETGTVHIRSGLAETTKEAIYLPNNWTFVEDVTD